MRPDELKSKIVSLVNAGTPIHLRSQPGQAKSDTVNSLPSVLEEATGDKWGIITVHLALMDAPDIKGFLVPQKTDEGPISTYTKPDLVHQVESMLHNGKDRVMVFFDERGQSDALVQKAVAPILLDNRIGDYHFPEGTYFISASNRVADKAGVTKELTHLTNREIQLDFNIQIEDWVKWARSKKVHEMLLGFAMFKPGVIIQDKVPAVTGPYCTPRSYAAACRYLGGIAGDTGVIPTDELTQEIVAGSIGAAASSEMFAFLATREHLPDWQDILDDPMKAKVPPKNRIDAMFAVASMVISRTTADSVEPAIEYVTRLNLELQTSVIKQLVESLGSVAMNCTHVQKFIKENQALILGSV